ncbi:MAG: FAD-dependent oxidoreductase, partial [Caldimonas sp.]
MQIAVIGAGVIGVTTAYELAVDGHEVTVFEHAGTVAAGGSFANAGLVAPGYVAPWAAPGMPGKVLRYLFAEHGPVRIAGLPDAAALGWAWRWWRACSPAVYRANRARMHRLAHYSRERLVHLAQRLHLEFERAQGFLVLLRSARDMALAEAGVRALAELGAAPAVLDAAGCRAIEPGLHPQTPLFAGLYSKDDVVGNCREFTHLLRKEAARAGARFRFNAHVEAI